MSRKNSLVVLDEDLAVPQGEGALSLLVLDLEHVVEFIDIGEFMLVNCASLAVALDWQVTFDVSVDSNCHFAV